MMNWIVSKSEEMLCKDRIAIIIMLGIFAVAILLIVLDAGRIDSSDAQSYDMLWQLNKNIENRTMQSVKLINGELIVTTRVDWRARYGSRMGEDDLTPRGSYMLREIYIARDEQIILDRTVRGEVIPAETTPEKIEWEE